MVMRLLAAALVTLSLSGCGLAYRAATGQPEPAGAPAAPRPLSAEERGWAETAWRYFANNHNAGTGLANAVDGYPTATAWEIGDTIAAVIAAEQLGLEGRAAAVERLGRIVAFVGRMELSYGRLPNRTYHAATGVMSVDAAQAGNVGWSAVDTGRLLIWLRRAAQYDPALAAPVSQAVGRLSLCEAVGGNGGLTGAAAGGPEPQRYREAGRGYEDYAAIGYRLWGIDARPPRLTDPMVQVSGIGFVSARPDRANEFTPVVTGDSMLAGIEFGWAAPADPGQARRARSVFLAQESRRRRDGIVTARNDFLRATAPYFLYGTLAASGAPWAVLTPAGESVPDYALLSTKGAFGLWSHWPDRGAALIQAVAPLHTERGWQEGRYERDGTVEPAVSASTNAVVLEALLHRARGPILAGLTAEPTRRCGPG